MDKKRIRSERIQQHTRVRLATVLAFLLGVAGLTLIVHTEFINQHNELHNETKEFELVYVTTETTKEAVPVEETIDYDPEVTEEFDEMYENRPPWVPEYTSIPILQKLWKKCGSFNVTKCLEFLSNYPGFQRPNSCLDPNFPNVTVHTFWYGPVTRSLAFMMKSFLYHHHSCAKLNVWLYLERDEDRTRGPWVQDFLNLRNIEFIPINWRELAKDTVFASREERIFKIAAKKLGQLAEISDLFRFLVLQKHGGMYVDADMLFMRDFSPLWYYDFEFAYQWSSTPQYNTAVLKLNKNSAVGAAIVNRVIERPELLQPSHFHPFAIQEHLRGTGMHLPLIPVPVFDPWWLRGDQAESSLNPVTPDFKGFQEFWIENGNFDISDFFPGCFAFHWHNNWHLTPSENSYARKFERLFDDFMDNKIPNAHGEKFSSLVLHRINDEI